MIRILSNSFKLPNRSQLRFNSSFTNIKLSIINSRPRPSSSISRNLQSKLYQTRFQSHHFNLSKRFINLQSNSNHQKVPDLTSPIVAHHLLIVATLVFSIVVVGGLTRLTESGLSITEWNLISGTLPPLSEQEWFSEFEKYKKTPEFKLLNQSIDLDSFKTIYLWEWSHRMIGRLIGLTFLLPIPFFIRYKLIRSQQIKLGLFGIGTLIGAQGGLGWYMVKSGLDQSELNKRDGIPRVSQYRLAAHLAMAFVVYGSCLRLAGGILRDWRLFYQNLPIGGMNTSVLESVKVLESKVPMRARGLVHSVTGLVFLTAVSGAFVAGLDAGLVYNTFPLMGDHLIPPKSELISTTITNRNEGRPGWIRNIFENPTTVQFDHRVLASLTFTSIIGLFTYLTKKKTSLPPTTSLWIRSMLGMVSIQVGLGISTLVYLVPTSLAAAHQAGSLVLLSLSIATGISLRKPNRRIFLQYLDLMKSKKTHLKPIEFHNVKSN
ncbi:uncharacterized protein MELLADRAFT_49716 [Melampsora larici-populina 98AG31]|uniref:Uncharacterized protein n=1 Tax=Melampsora larici-populina (strain 98AG31 / pathotype 3-4-7) TaxID=747676 RepID=F4RXN3_MELLP|nr:uncharacterized protein MELLADRAFT_49716 [Melampsora larici-populina 98AG31]EGG02756.1 hypothetical protein MELLADRAFT_49716 [Melampsora larici-populina 98AG31]